MQLAVHEGISRGNACEDGRVCISRKKQWWCEEEMGRRGGEEERRSGPKAGTASRRSRQNNATRHRRPGTPSVPAFRVLGR